MGGDVLEPKSGTGPKVLGEKDKTIEFYSDDVTKMSFLKLWVLPNILLGTTYLIGDHKPKKMAL